MPIIWLLYSRAKVPSLHLCSTKAVATSTSSSTASKLWSHRRRSPSSSPSEAPFIVENDLSKLTQALGGLQDVTIEKDSYLFGEGKLFDELGMHQDLFRSLKNLGKEKATAIQALSFQTVASGKDAIIAAETGSGKTLAYLLPMIHQLLTIEDLGGFEGIGEQYDENDDKRRKDMETQVPWYCGSEGLRYPKCMIMVPNKELCAQVFKMASEVCDALRTTGGRIVTVEALSSFNGIWPYAYSGAISPNIIICTPSYIGNYIRGPNIVEERLFRNIRCLVLDEADMVLEGSYQKDVEKIMDVFKVVRRRMIREGEVQINTDTLQNVLAAATLPSFGLKSTEKYIQKRYPRAIKISNAHMHKHHPRIKQEFVELDEEEDLSSQVMIELIVDAIGDVKSDDDNRGGTMIFVNTANEAVKLASKLRNQGIECSEFHKLRRFDEKEHDLKLFQSGGVPVLVCTDHASRGLDLPGVYHVIQAEFALNVVNHLHRIGRASRAGNFGRATNFYGRSSKDLVESILSDDVEGKVDQSFSRKRGLRARLKKDAKRNVEE